MRTHITEDDSGAAVGLTIGMLVGGFGGFAIWMVIGEFVFLPAFIAVGAVLGLILGSSLGKRDG